MFKLYNFDKNIEKYLDEQLKISSAEDVHNLISANLDYFNKSVIKKEKNTNLCSDKKESINICSNKKEVNDNIYVFCGLNKKINVENKTNSNIEKYYKENIKCSNNLIEEIKKKEIYDMDDNIIVLDGYLKMNKNIIETMNISASYGDYFNMCLYNSLSYLLNESADKIYEGINGHELKKNDKIIIDVQKNEFKEYISTKKIFIIIIGINSKGIYASRIGEFNNDKKQIHYLINTNSNHWTVPTINTRKELDKLFV